MPITLPRAEYRELARWFPSVTDRARALGRSRETLTSWERGRLECTVKPSTARRITRVASVAEDVERLIGDARGVGRWMLAPQPQFLGKTPVEMIAAVRLGDLSRVVYGGEEISSRPANLGYEPGLMLCMVRRAPSDGAKIAPGKLHVSPVEPAPSV